METLHHGAVYGLNTEIYSVNLHRDFPTVAFIVNSEVNLGSEG